MNTQEKIDFAKMGEDIVKLQERCYDSEGKIAILTDMIDLLNTRIVDLESTTKSLIDIGRGGRGSLRV